MRHLAVIATLGALCVTPAFAGSSVVRTPVQGGLGPPEPIAAYDTFPFWLGGGGTGGSWGAKFEPGTWLFPIFEQGAHWGDHLHLAEDRPPVVTRLRYGYYNTIAATTHVIRFWESITPTLPTVTGPIVKGPLITSIIVPSNPAASSFVTLDGLELMLPSTVWITFEDTGPGASNTLWLTGGLSRAGTSELGLLRTDGSGDTWMPFEYYLYPYKYYGKLYYYPIAGNLSVALLGPVPAPATLALLGLGGLAVLRRRRAR